MVRPRASSPCANSAPPPRAERPIASRQPASRQPASRRAAWQRGVRAEAWVAEQLAALGWHCVVANWSAAGGEVDLIVERDGELRFVEVRARQPGDDSALESIDHGKRRRLSRAAEAYLAQHPPSGDVAFMVAIVELNPAGWQVDLIDDAFDG